MNNVSLKKKFRSDQMDNGQFRVYNVSFDQNYTDMYTYVA